MAEKATKLSWYPIRVFFGRAEKVRVSLEEGDVEYFCPTHIAETVTSGGVNYIEEPLVRSLMFVNTTFEGLRALRSKFSGSVVPYYDRQTGTPLVVPDNQMEMFIKLCKMKKDGLQYLGDDAPKYHKGDRVRVIDGIFKGLEGHIKRIRHDRKLIVTIEGVAAFATSHIPPAFLEKVEE